MQKAETVLSIIRERAMDLYSRNRSLESHVTRKRSRVVRRGAVGKVPVWVTRWPPTLRHAGACPERSRRNLCGGCRVTDSPTVMAHPSRGIVSAVCS